MRVCLCLRVFYNYLNLKMDMLFNKDVEAKLYLYYHNSYHFLSHCHASDPGLTSLQISSNLVFAPSGRFSSHERNKIKTCCMNGEVTCFTSQVVHQHLKPSDGVQTQWWCSVVVLLDPLFTLFSFSRSNALRVPNSNSPSKARLSTTTLGIPLGANSSRVQNVTPIVKDGG